MINSEKILQTVEQLYLKVFRTAEEIIPGILLILLSVLVAFLVEYTVRILLRLLRLDRLIEKSRTLNALSTMGIKLQSHVYIGKLFFWITFLILLEASAEVVGWTSISGKFDEYAMLLPLLIGAAVISAVGLFISKMIRDVMRAVLTRAGSKAAVIISNVSYYALLALSATVALGYMGFNTSIITANVTVVLASLLFAFSLAFVFASKDLLHNILSSSYNKSTFKVGQRVSVNGSEGEIIKMTNSSVFVRSSKKVMVVPARKFTDEIVEIVGWEEPVPKPESGEDS